MEDNNQFSLDKIKNAYMDKMHYIYPNIIPNEDESRYSWIGTKKLTINIYYITILNTTWYLMFATKNYNNKDKLNHRDFTSETNNIDFEELTYVTDMLSWILSNCPTSINKNDIINASIQKFSSNSTRFGNNYKTAVENWVKKEYSQTQTALQNKTKITKLPTNQKFFVDRYHFEDMLNSINDDQFTDEFNQCLFAYNHEKWFLCAAGLGSCLEHLMYIIIANYGNFKNLGKNPTFKDYITKFKQPPISISSRQATFISLLFMARNSVDHHNTGNTQKNICDLLLDGISDVYNDYYPDSILAKKDD